MAIPGDPPNYPFQWSGFYGHFGQPWATYEQVRAVAQKCPVCCGSGEVVGNTQNCTTNPWPKVCHGCNGKGWVAV